MLESPSNSLKIHIIPYFPINIESKNGSWRWRPGPDDVILIKKNMHKHTPIMQTSIKNRHPNLKYFFTRLSPSIQGTKNSLTQSAGELWPWNRPKVSICGGRILTNFCLWSHNFGSRYASKPIKDSKDSDDSLRSKTKLSQKMAHWVGVCAR